MRIPIASFTTLLLVYGVVASPVGEREKSGFQFLSKRVTKPAVPSASDLKSHLLTPDRDECMFYTGGTLIAAQDYADANDKVLLGDLNKDGWAAPSETDDDGDDDYAKECPLSINFQSPLQQAGVGWGQSDLDAYWDNMSQAYTEICSGTILLALPPSLSIPLDGVFARIEWPVIRAGGAIDRIDIIKLNTGEADGTPLSAPTKFWERCEG